MNIVIVNGDFIYRSSTTSPSSATCIGKEDDYIVVDMEICNDGETQVCEYSNEFISVITKTSGEFMY